MVEVNFSKVLCGLCCLCLVGTAGAQGKYDLGKVVHDDQIASWNIDVAPDGKALPPGRGTVQDGEKIYQTACLACHGTNLEGGMGPALMGGKGSLTSAKPLKTVGSYWPYATTLFDYIRRAMPFQQPQSLTNDQVYAVTGYLLYRNEILKQDAVVDAEALRGVVMPNANAFYVDDRPDVKAIACYTGCK